MWCFVNENKYKMIIACMAFMALLQLSREEAIQFTQCSYGPFVLLSNAIPNWNEASLQCHSLPSGLSTNIYSLAEISDPFLEQVVSTLSLSACQQPLSSTIWIGSASNNVFAFGHIPPTGIAPQTVLLNQGLCFGRPTYTESFNPFFVTTTVVDYTQPPPVLTTITNTVTISTATTTAPPQATTTQLTILTTTSQTVNESDQTTTTTVTTSTITIETETINTTNNTTTITQIVTITHSIITTDSTITITTLSTTITSLTDGIQTITHRATTTLTSCPSVSTTLTITATTTIASATTTSTSTIRTLSSLSTQTITTGPCLTQTKTIPTTCTLRQVATITQTEILAPFNPCNIGQKLSICGVKSNAADDGLVLILNQVPAMQSKCMCESIGKKVVDVDDDIAAADAFNLIHLCVGERQYAWIGAIEGKSPKDGCLAAQSGPIVGSKKRGMLGRPNPCSAFLPILCH